MLLSNNYWGGAEEELVDIAVNDFSDDFNLMRANTSPFSMPHRNLPIHLLSPLA